MKSVSRLNSVSGLRRQVLESHQQDLVLREEREDVVELLVVSAPGVVAATAPPPVGSCNRRFEGDVGDEFLPLRSAAHPSFHARCPMCEMARVTGSRRIITSFMSGRYSWIRRRAIGTKQ